MREHRAIRDYVNAFKTTVTAILAAMTALWGWFGWVVVEWIICMAIDYLMGSAAALRAGEWSSSKARDGIWHKVKSIAAVVISAILDMVIRIVLENCGFNFSIDYSVLLSPLVAVWYILTEAGSIVENAGALGVPIPDRLKKAIAVLKSNVDDAAGIDDSE